MQPTRSHRAKSSHRRHQDAAGRWRRLVLILVSATAALALSVPVALPAAATFAPGSQGLGDPYFGLQGNGGYDVQHYDIALRHDPAQTTITARTTIEAIATQTLTSFYLDMRRLHISSITVNGSAVPWERESQDVQISLFGALYAGMHFTIVVDYDGDPLGPWSDGPGWLRTVDGALVVAEPNAASSWFPSNDHPSDKALFDITLTVPPGVSAISNGLPGPATVGADGWSTTTWHSREPMATYLATVAIGDYTIERSTTASGIPVINAIGKDAVGDVEELGRLDDIVTYLESYLGPYPFETVGSIVSSGDFWSALETQTRPIYAKSFFTGTNNAWAPTVMLHELAHQWFGDSVTIGIWKDIWLNEGFATYMQWLWEEHEDLQTADQAFNILACRPASDRYAWLAAADPRPENLFSRGVYDNGAMTLHALRRTVGDATFFAILRKWAEPGDGKSRSTAQFIDLAEQMSGQQLDAFFTTWIGRWEKPSGLSCDAVQAPSAPTNVSVTIDPAGKGAATVRWSPPASNGGQAISGYQVQRDGAYAGSVTSTARSFTITDLYPDAQSHPLTLSVVALNPAAVGPAGAATTTVPSPAPSTPRTVTATGANRQVTVKWTPPINQGNSKLTRYTIRTFAAGSSTVLASQAVAPGTLQYIKTGLTNGTRYEFDVNATNELWGIGATSARIAATPATVPGAPLIQTAAAGTTGGAITATAKWAPPTSTGGSTISGYRVYALRMSAAGAVLATTTSATQPASTRSFVMTLPQIGNYRFQLIAINRMGDSARSARSNLVAGR